MEVIVFVMLCIAALFVIAFVVFLTLRMLHRRVKPGTALVIMKARGMSVAFADCMLPPFSHAEVMLIRLIGVEIDRRGITAPTCKDCIRADFAATFYVHVVATEKDVLKVATLVGCEAASDVATLTTLFQKRFEHAVSTVMVTADFDDWVMDGERLRQEILRAVGQDLEGYRLSEVAIHYFEQTPIEMLDQSNVRDANAIRKITDITTKANITTNKLKNEERLKLNEQNLRADEAIYRADFEREQLAKKRAALTAGAAS